MRMRKPTHPSRHGTSTSVSFASSEVARESRKGQASWTVFGRHHAAASVSRLVVDGHPLSEACSGAHGSDEGQPWTRNGTLLFQSGGRQRRSRRPARGAGPECSARVSAGRRTPSAGSWRPPAWLWEPGGDPGGPKPGWPEGTSAGWSERRRRTAVRRGSRAARRRPAAGRVLAVRARWHGPALRTGAGPCRPEPGAARRAGQARRGRCRPRVPRTRARRQACR